MKYIKEKDIGKLKKLYNQAIKDKKESFTFQKSEILTKYAQYVIEYAETIK